MGKQLSRKYKEGKKKDRGKGTLGSILTGEENKHLASVRWEYKQKQYPLSLLFKNTKHI